MVYPLTEYRNARMMAVLWPRSHCRATSANAASTSGFRVKATQKTQRSVLSASRLTGTPREKVTEKRRNEGRFSCPIGLESNSSKAQKNWAAANRRPIGKGRVKLVRAGRIELPTSGVRTPALYPTELRPHGNRVGKRLSNVCVYPVLFLPLAPLHLQSCDFRKITKLLSVSIWESLPNESGELRLWGLPLLSVCFRWGCAARNGAACFKITSKQAQQAHTHTNSFLPQGQVVKFCSISCGYLVYKVEICGKTPFIHTLLTELIVGLRKCLTCTKVSTSAEIRPPERGPRSGIKMLWPFDLRSSRTKFLSESRPFSQLAFGQDAKNPMVHSCSQFLSSDAIEPQGIDGNGFVVVQCFDFAANGFKGCIEIAKGLVDEALALLANLAGFRLIFSHNARSIRVIVVRAASLREQWRGPFHVIGGDSDGWQAKSDLPNNSTICPTNTRKRRIFRQSQYPAVILLH
jgi:hypothetical protein